MPSSILFTFRKRVNFILSVLFLIMASVVSFI